MPSNMYAIPRQVENAVAINLIFASSYAFECIVEYLQEIGAIHKQSQNAIASVGLKYPNRTEVEKAIRSLPDEAMPGLMTILFAPGTL